MEARLKTKNETMYHEWMRLPAKSNNKNTERKVTLISIGTTLIPVAQSTNA